MSFSWFAFALMAVLVMMGFWNEPEVIRWAGIVALIFLSFGGAHYLISKGARKKRNWARILSVIYALAVLPGFPLFTFISFFLLKNMRWRK